MRAENWSESVVILDGAAYVRSLARSSATERVSGEQIVSARSN